MKRRVPKTKGRGWDVFDSEGSDISGGKDGWLSIQRIDDPDLDYGTERVTYTPAFRNDRQAIEYVIRCARRGNAEAIKALWLTLDSDDLVNRIMCEMTL